MVFRTSQQRGLNIGLVRFAGSLPLQLYFFLFGYPLKLPFCKIYACRERSARLLVALLEEMLREVILEAASWCAMLYDVLLASSYALPFSFLPNRTAL